MHKILRVLDRLISVRENFDTLFTFGVFQQSFNHESLTLFPVFSGCSFIGTTSEGLQVFDAFLLRGGSRPYPDVEVLYAVRNETFVGPFLPWVCIVGACRGCISWVYIVGACRGYASWVHVVGAYRGCMSWVCIVGVCRGLPEILSLWIEADGFCSMFP